MASQNTAKEISSLGDTVMSNISIVGVSKLYEGEKDTLALKEINLEIQKGEFLTVVGPSGCGKSTLLGLIAGLDKPSKGSITLNGVKITKPGPDRLLMFQEHALFPWLSVIENVAFGLRSKYRSKQECLQVAGDFLEMVHLEEFRNSFIHELSGGMRHRVALARALAPDPAVLLIDEPFQALDAITRSHLYAEIQEIHQKTGKTIISVSHDTREAACLADRVVVMSSRPGMLVAEVLVNIPRPRNINDDEVSQIARIIDKHLRLRN